MIDELILLIQAKIVAALVVRQSLVGVLDSLSKRMKEGAGFKLGDVIHLERP
jgi:hypothetical protein